MKVNHNASFIPKGQMLHLLL